MPAFRRRVSAGAFPVSPAEGLGLLQGLALSKGLGLADSGPSLSYNKGMKNATKTKVVNIGRTTVRAIKLDVKLGLIRPEGPDEKPNRANVRALGRQAAVRAWPNWSEVVAVFKTKSQYELFDQYVWQRLRRDSVLKTLRNMTA